MRNLCYIFCTAIILSLLATQAYAMESYGKPEDPLVAEVLGMQIRTKNPDEMQYGGRIIFQQSGPEPLDVRKDYLKEQQKKGAFTIFEKSFEPPFWEYFVTDSKHSFYKQGSEEERRAFDNPFGLQKQ